MGVRGKGLGRRRFMVFWHRDTLGLENEVNFRDLSLAILRLGEDHVVWFLGPFIL